MEYQWVVENEEKVLTFNDLDDAVNHIYRKLESNDCKEFLIKKYEIPKWKIKQVLPEYDVGQVAYYADKRGDEFFCVPCTIISGPHQDTFMDQKHDFYEIEFDESAIESKIILPEQKISRIMGALVFEKQMSKNEFKPRPIF